MYAARLSTQVNIIFAKPNFEKQIYPFKNAIKLSKLLLLPNVETFFLQKSWLLYPARMSPL